MTLVDVVPDPESGVTDRVLVHDLAGHYAPTGGRLTVEPLESLEEAVAHRAVSIGIITTPAAAAQDVTDRFVAAGIRSILNFAPAVLKCPPGVQVRRVDLSSELQILAYHQSQGPG